MSEPEYIIVQPGLDGAAWLGEVDHNGEASPIGKIAHLLALAAERDEARALVAAGLALADDWAEIPDHGMYGDPMMRAVVSNLRAALTTPTESETP